MSLQPTEQFDKFLEKSKNILVLIPQNPNCDCVGAAWGLHFFLKNRNVPSDIAFSGALNEKFAFLPRPKSILSEISGARDFVLSFDTTRNKIKNIRHEKTGDKFNIFITPEKGSLNPKDFSFILAKFKYDLIVSIGASDLEKLGKIYLDNPDLFFEVPIANIDRQSENDNFGQINLIDVTASANSEIIASFLEKNHPEELDETVATCLLFGIIGATESFQKKNTTPRALLAASSLMDKGANQQEIIRWLYKTHPLHILKLWGRAMAKINWHPEIKLAWSTLTVEDFVQSRSVAADTPLILEKLEESYSEGKIFMLVRNNTPENSTAEIRTARKETLADLQTFLGGEIENNLLKITLAEADLEKSGQIIAEKIRGKISPKNAS